jgi:uncharacterized protein with HEPN domain
MKLETAKRLLDAMRACRELQDICAGQTRESYLSNRLLNLSVWKLVEIVGEALRQAEMTDPSLVERIADLRAIVNTRHRITHGYDSVNFNLLWDIVQVEIPPLEETLRALVNEAPDVSESREKS